MDELMMYEYLNRRGMGGMSESEMIMLSCLRVGLVTM